MVLNWETGTGGYVRPDGVPVYVVRDRNRKPFMVFWPDAEVGNSETRRLVVRDGDQLVVMPFAGDSELTPLVLVDGMTGSWEDSGAQVFTPEPLWKLLARPVPPQAPAIKRTVMAAAVPEDLPSGMGAMLTGTALTPGRRYESGDPVEDEEPACAQSSGLKVIVKEIFQKYRVGRGPRGVILLADDDQACTVDELGGWLGNQVVDYKWDLLRALRRDARTVNLQEVPVQPFPQRGFLVSSGDGKPWLWHNPDVEGDDEVFARRRESFGLNLRSAESYAWPMAVNNSQMPFLAVVGTVSRGDHVRPRNRQGDLDLLVRCPRQATRNITVVVLTGKVGLATPRGLAVLSYRPHLDADGMVTFDTAMRVQHRRPYVVAFDNKGGPRVFKRF